MKVTRIAMERWKSVLAIVITGGIIGALFCAVFPNNSLTEVLIGAIIGTLISFILSFYTVIFTARFLNHMFLLPKLLLDYLVYSVTICTVMVVFMLLFKMIPNATILTIWTYPSFSTAIIFSLVISFMFCVGILINSLLGKGVLVKMLFGFYHHPSEEERIFMFLDVKDSTTIAEKVGHLKFLSLLDDFFYDISEAILLTKGEIYKYVGDEVIITWKIKHGTHDANCIRCFIYIEEKMELEKAKYLSKYGIIPDFKAGIHGGKVVIGEMGLLKKEITYLGDVLNTTARIESECNKFGESLLVSGETMRQLIVPETASVINYGPQKLRGKELEVELFGIRRKSQ